jgi:amino acid transporter
MIGACILLAFAIIMFAFGRWGRSHATELAAGDASVGTDRTERKRRAIRRGGIAWQIAATGFLIMGIVTIISAH